MTGEMSSLKEMSPLTYLGLCVALGGPFLPYLFDPVLFGTAWTALRIEWDIGIHWLNLGVLIAVILFAEKLPLVSIGLRALRWWTLPLGLIAGAIILSLGGFLVSALKVGSEEHFAAFLMSLPFVVRLLIVLTAGIFEETLFRGYALERLAAAFNNKWVAGAITVVIFTLAHVPAVGLTHLLPVFIVSVFITLLYLWRRDLVVNIIAHVTIDGVALLGGPFLSHH